MSAGCQNYTQLQQINKPVMRPEYRTVGIYGLIWIKSSGGLKGSTSIMSTLLMFLVFNKNLILWLSYESETEYTAIIDRPLAGIITFVSPLGLLIKIPVFGKVAHYNSFDYIKAKKGLADYDDIHWARCFA